MNITKEQHDRARRELGFIDGISPSRSLIGCSHCYQLQAQDAQGNYYYVCIWCRNTKINSTKAKEK